MMLIWSLLWLLILAVIVVGVVFLIRASWSGRPSRPGGGWTGDALDVLRERYARGEIDRQEFEERRRDLEDAPR